MATIDPNKEAKTYTEKELNTIQEYQQIHTRLRILKAQMADIHDETNDLIETLDQMRLKENKQNIDGKK